MPRSTLLLLPMTFALAACAGAAPAATAPGTRPPTAATTPSTPAAASTVSAATGAPVPSTDPPTTPAPTTTVAPPTTLDLIVEMDAAVQAMYAGIRECLGDPTSCDVGTFAATGTEFHANWAATVQRLAGSNQYALIQPVTNRTTEKVSTVSDDHVSVTVCSVDGDWLMQADDTPDRSDDAIVNDLIVPSRVEYLFRRAPAGWEPTSAMLIAKFEQGATACDAA